MRKIFVQIIDSIGRDPVIFKQECGFDKRYEANQRLTYVVTRIDKQGIELIYWESVDEDTDEEWFENNAGKIISEVLGEYFWVEYCNAYMVTDNHVVITIDNGWH